MLRACLVASVSTGWPSYLLVEVVVPLLRSLPMLMQVQKMTTMMGPCPFARILRDWPLREWRASHRFDTVLTDLYVIYCLLMETLSRWCCKALAY